MKCTTRAFVCGLLAATCASCQPLLDLRVALSGSTSPRNEREKVIFDYHHFLKTENYQAAYRLRHPATVPDYATFAAYRRERRKYLPPKIAIGEERQRDISSEPICGYGYDVYVIDPGSTSLTMGQIGLMPNSNQPNSCVIAYNSAFGHP